jgi:hypothetical protein
MNPARRPKPKRPPELSAVDYLAMQSALMRADAKPSAPKSFLTKFSKVNYHDKQV